MPCGWGVGTGGKSGEGVRYLELVGAERDGEGEEDVTLSRGLLEH